MSIQSKITPERHIEKLTKINQALMARVERSTDQQGNAYSLFTAAIALEGQVLRRTDELNNALSRLKHTNDALVIARDAAERANEVKTRFFTAVGHDLLQPLHAARLSVSALEESNDISEHRKLATQIDHALGSIEDILRSILDISKLETGVTHPAPEPVSLAGVFKSLVLDFSPITSEKGLVLVAESHDLWVMSDPLLLRRILQNLMSNAVRYTEHGRITLTAEKIGNVVDITVGDTGPGIAESERECIFEEFQRGSASGRTSASGTGFGLGLSIVQRMAKALHHPIKLKSAVGEGSHFTVTANATEAVAEQTAASPSQSVLQTSYGFEKFQIIVIDNDIPVLEAMSTLLGQWFCKTTLVRSLTEVDSYLSENSAKPDIILADYHLDSHTCGVTAVERVRAKWGDDVPAIIITADHGEATEEHARASRCELVRKPVRPAALRALMSHLLKE